jgi:hypothetical protein
VTRIAGIGRWFMSIRLGTILGIGCFLAALPLYRSYEHHPVLNRWSCSYFAIMMIGLLIWLGLVTWFARRRSSARPTARALILDVAVMLWGVAYLWTALSDPRLAARIVDGNVVGSSIPAGAALEGVSILLLFLALCAVLWTYRSRSWANLGLLGWTLVLTAVVGESWCRVSAVIHPSTTGVPSYSSDLWYRRYVRRNLNGWRDADHSIDAEHGVPRLLVIGDSYAFGAGIRNMQDRFGEQLANDVARLSNVTWESINVSRGDSHTLDEIGFLRYGLRYHPSAVVLVYVFNDLDYLVPITSRPAVFERPKGLTARLSPVRLAYWNSYFFQAIYARVRLAAARWRDRRAFDPQAAYDDSTLVARHMQDLKRLWKLAVDHGCIFGIVPFNVDVVADSLDRARYERFVTEARRSGLPIWDVSGAFEGCTLSQLAVNRLDSHPNELAHRLAADAVAPLLLAEWRSTGSAPSP